MERILLILCFLYLVVLAVRAGTCFRTRDAFGKCQRPILSGVSRSYCCRRRGSFFTFADYGSSWWETSVRNNGANNCTRTCGMPNSCSRLACPYNKVCQMSRGRPYCMCNVRCSPESRIRREVCASDGRTYPSLCAMESAKCRNNDIITRVRYYGNCLQQSNTCSSNRCPFGKVCLLNEMGRPICQIRAYCRVWPNDVSVCGRDGVTYSNKCFLTKAGQDRGREIGVAHRGNCSASSQRPRSVSSIRWLSL